MSSQIKSAVEAMLIPYLDEQGFELVDVEYLKEGSNWFLRVYVDKENGIDIDDCGQISEFLSTHLDAIDPIPTAYFLEISSPGAERPLKKPDDFRKAIDNHILITTYEPIEGLKEFEGKLISYDEEYLSIQVGKKKYNIACDKVAAARYAILF